MWPEIWIGMSKAARKKEKHQWANEKPKLNNARQLRGIYFDDPEAGESKEGNKTAQRKSEVPLEAAMPLQDGCVSARGTTQKFGKEGSTARSYSKV